MPSVCLLTVLASLYNWVPAYLKYRDVPSFLSRSSDFHYLDLRLSTFIPVYRIYQHSPTSTPQNGRFEYSEASNQHARRRLLQCLRRSQSRRPTLICLQNSRRHIHLRKMEYLCILSSHQQTSRTRVRVTGYPTEKGHGHDLYRPHVPNLGHPKQRTSPPSRRLSALHPLSRKNYCCPLDHGKQRKLHSQIFLGCRESK